MNTTNHTPAKKFFFFIFLFPLLVLGLGALIMVLWNALLPDIIGASKINYWQAMGLFILSRILFGGFRFGGGGGKPGFGGPQQHWKQKWMNMSDEEKARVKETWQKRCEDRKQ